MRRNETDFKTHMGQSGNSITNTTFNRLMCLDQKDLAANQTKVMGNSIAGDFSYVEINLIKKRDES